MGLRVLANDGEAKGVLIEHEGDTRVDILWDSAFTVTVYSAGTAKQYYSSFEDEDSGAEKVYMSLMPQSQEWLLNQDCHSKQNTFLQYVWVGCGVRMMHSILSLGAHRHFSLPWTDASTQATIETSS